MDLVNVIGRGQNVALFLWLALPKPYLQTLGISKCELCVLVSNFLKYEVQEFLPPLSCCVFKSLQCPMEEKHSMLFQSENRVFTFESAFLKISHVNWA